MDIHEKITSIIKYRYPLIYIFTEEEERLEQILININKDLFNQSVCTWDFIEGYQNQPDYFLSCKQNPLEALTMIERYNQSNSTFFLLKDFHCFLHDVSINRKLKNLHRWLRKHDKYLIISGTETNIPSSLREYVKYIKLPLPTEQEINLEIENFIHKTGLQRFIHKDIICRAYRGLSIKQIRESLLEILSKDIKHSDILTNILLTQGRATENINGLKFYPLLTNNIKLGGLENLKQWLKVRQSTFSREAQAYGIKAPQGILLVGIQGTGKSISAQAISYEWNLPLFKLDVGQLFTSALGESEKKVEQIIEICTLKSPCILWIDEIDKIFTKHILNNDSGTTQRVTNIFLTWLSEKKDNVFIIATANKIEYLPLEMLRKGRFDEIFFLDLPKFKDRMSIFQLHMKKVRPLTWNKYNIYYFSKISQGFSGAEIEQSIINAMYTGFYENREFTSSDVIHAIKNITPISTAHYEEISAMRSWGYSGKVTIA